MVFGFGDDDDDDYDDDDDSSFFSFLTPTTTFVICAIFFLLIYIIYEYFVESSSVSTSYICFAIIGIFIGSGCIVYMKTYSSIVEWMVSIILTFGTAMFYYLFML